MVDFRYHVVSIIAVFLALAIGMIIGTAALNGAVLNDLEKRVDNLQEDNAELDASLKQSERDAEAADIYAVDSQPLVLPGTLGGASTVVVLLPEATSEQIEGAVSAVRESGSAITGRVTIDPSYAEEANAQALLDLVPQLLPSGVEVPATDDPYEQVAVLLASVLMRGPDGSAATPSEISTALAGLEGLGVLEATDITGPANLALSVAGGPSGTAEESEALNDALLPLFAELDEAGRGTLVAGPVRSAEDGGVVAAVRDSQVNNTVSTLDNLHRTVGQTVVPAGLDSDREGVVGQYGTGRGATTPVPPLS